MRIPAKWQKKNLGELYEIARGGSPRPIQAYLTNAADGINWIKISDATASTKYIYETKEKIKPEGAKRSRLVEKGDFILSNSMSFGRPYIMRTSGCIHDGWLVLKDKSKAINPDFLYYFLCSQFAFSQFDELARGSTVRNLNIDLVSRVKTVVPPRSEQNNIVAILDDAFERIDKAIANTEKNIANAKELFESCLESTFANLVGKTTSCKIKECTKFIDYRGKTPEKTECGLRLITAKNVKKGVLQKTPEEFVSPEVYDTWMTRGIPKIGDVLFTTEAPLGNVAQLDTSEKVVFAQRIIIIQPAAKILDSRFFKYLLLSPQMQKTIDSLGTGATAKGIKAKVLKEIEITFPQALSAQVCIAERLEQTENFCRDVGSKLVQKISTLQALKQSLLAAAFSGELTADFNPDALEL